MEQALKQLVVVSLSNSALKQLASFEARFSWKIQRMPDISDMYIDLYKGDTVDGWNLAPPGMYETLLIMG